MNNIEEALLKSNPPIEHLFNSLKNEEDLFEVYFLETDMSKTTPKWKNSFANVRDRFGNDNSSKIIYSNQQQTLPKNFLTNGIKKEQEKNSYTMLRNDSDNKQNNR